MAAIQVVLEEEEYRCYPICEECGGRITDAGLALIIFSPTPGPLGTPLSQPLFVHKGMCDRLLEQRNRHLLAAGQPWYTEEFDAFLVFMGNNLRLNWDRRLPPAARVPVKRPPGRPAL